MKFLTRLSYSLTERKNEVAGTAVFAAIEGSSPLLVEIEALVAHSSLATPRRNVVGWENSGPLC